MKKRFLVILLLIIIILTGLIIYYITDLNKNGGSNNIYKLNIAIQDNDIDKVKKLIEKTNLNGYYMSDDCDTAEGGFIDCLSPLQTACYTGKNEIVKLLVENGADVNYQDKYIKSTPLIEIVNFNGEENVNLIANYLLDHGADKTKKDRFGKTAMDYAKKTNNKDLIELLQ